MPKIFWTYAGRMAFSILGSVAGALIVSHFGLLQLKPEPRLEKIVFDQSDLTRYDNIAQRVEAGHVALHELKAKREAEERRRAAAEAAERKAAEAEKEAAEKAQRSLAAAHPAMPADRKKTAAPKREAPLQANAAPPAAPLVITPAAVAERPAPEREGLEGVFDKLASGVGKIRDFVVNAVRIEKPSNLPFGSASTSSGSLPGVGDLESSLKLPAFNM